MTEVRAAGGVVLDNRDGVAHVLVVHRPRYDDWSLPKGKLEDGEDFEEAAVRELHEETGVRARLGPALTSTHYVDRFGQPKVVRWWAMSPTAIEARRPDDEVDEVRWLPVDDAAAVLTHDADRALVQEATKGAGARTILVVRHALAGDRDAWQDDDRIRPLDARGRSQADDLVDVLDPWDVRRIVSSAYVRCDQTVQPLAAARALDVEHHEGVAEGAPRQATLELLASVETGTVLCSHGDVIGDLVTHLADEDGRLDGIRLRWRKASTWVLTLDDRNRVTRARLLAPPSA